jgi:hypothetical protein
MELEVAGGSAAGGSAADEAAPVAVEQGGVVG